MVGDPAGGVGPVVAGALAVGPHLDGDGPQGVRLRSAGAEGSPAGHDHLLSLVAVVPGRQANRVLGVRLHGRRIGQSQNGNVIKLKK